MESSEPPRKGSKSSDLSLCLEKSGKVALVKNSRVQKWHQKHPSRHHKSRRRAELQGCWDLEQEIDKEKTRQLQQELDEMMK